MGIGGSNPSLSAPNYRELYSNLSERHPYAVGSTTKGALRQAQCRQCDRSRAGATQQNAEETNGNPSLSAISNELLRFSSFPEETFQYTPAFLL